MKVLVASAQVLAQSQIQVAQVKVLAASAQVLALAQVLAQSQTQAALVLASAHQVKFHGTSP